MLDLPAHPVEDRTNDGPALAEVELSDKYAQERGRVFISGTQALVRLPLMQRERDLAAGHNTAGYISGYRGSPLGTYDSELWKAKSFLQERHVRFEPGVNEDLAATAVWGTQQVHTFEGARYDGVFAIWYGKGPGVDRSGDPIKHANLAGTAPLGGVLLVFGDDHAGKSSTVAHQSEQALAAHSVPVLYPATIQDYIDFGLLGWALSRYTGLCVGLKCVNETVENTASVDIDPDRSQFVLPQGQAMPAEGVNFSLASQTQFAPAEDEKRLVRFKLPLLQAFVRANPVDRVEMAAPVRELGIVTAGKSYMDVLHALAILGIDKTRAETLGLSLYKVGLIWPLATQGLHDFAQGHRELLFVEEKRAFMEEQASRILYNAPLGGRPVITGKLDDQGQPLLASDYVLDPLSIAQAIGARLVALGLADAALQDKLQQLARQSSRVISVVSSEVARTPYFCSGCPHNSSTNLPEGSQAVGGIGCHGMGIFMGRTLRSSQMGGEGLTWSGIAPFTSLPHVFQNLGDGTYSHSGLLAVHAAVTARTTITYKILFNDAVAMTGGQPVEGTLTVPAIARQMAALGVKAVRVVSDEPDKYPAGSFSADVSVHHRNDLDAVQRELREVKGVTVLIYDQTCAAEKRRRRKRGTMEDPKVRAFINSQVCEGCGDCSVKSNCVSVEPLETELGRKRRIEQSSCNKDLSCINGFCPSFVTVRGGSLRKRVASKISAEELARLPEPQVLPMEGVFNALIVGVGGTGVVTVGSVLGMAAHLEGKGSSVFDMTGMAQKGGAVLSHLKIARRPEDVHAVAIGPEESDLLLGCDLIVAASRDAARSIRQGRTRVVVNTRLVPTGAFQRRPDMDFQMQRSLDILQRAAGDGRLESLDASELGLQYTNNALSANMILVGCAYQLGALPLSREAIEKAIRLNGASVEQTLLAFSLGRLYAHDPQRFQQGAAGGLQQAPLSTERFVQRRVDDLTAYQNAAYAERYSALLARVRQVEERVMGSAPPASASTSTSLVDAVAKSYFKLLAYKDEYEVARLYTDGTFEKSLNEQFEGDFSVTFNLAPPILSRRDPQTGQLVKRSFGRWVVPVFKVLARLKGLRGTPFDVFGYTAERRTERELIAWYEGLVAKLVQGLTRDNHALALTIAQLPLEIRGYGHVKEHNLAAVRGREPALLSEFAFPAPIAKAA